MPLKYARDYAVKKGKVKKSYQPKHLRTAPLRLRAEAERRHRNESSGEKPEEKAQEEVSQSFQDLSMEANVENPKKRAYHKRKVKPIDKGKTKKGRPLSHAPENQE